jgi:hypothetical protein
MNELEFSSFIMEKVKKDKHLSKWYEKTLAHKGFDKTIELIVASLFDGNGLSFEQAVTISLFIGLSSNLVVEAKNLTKLVLPQSQQ